MMGKQHFLPEVYMKRHESFFSTKGDHLVCKSTKFIYDLKQGSRNGILNSMK